jgi:dipeptidyl aminopeptidase/acylaminoacyl peptidase
MTRSKFFFAISLIFLCVGFGLLNFVCKKNESLPEIIPRKVLFGNPSYLTPKISPDGRIIAYRAPFKGKLSLWIKTKGKNDDQPFTDAKNGDEQLVSGIGHFWAADSRHVFYLQDNEGDENWRLFSVDIYTKEVKDLTPFNDVQVQIVAMDKNHPNELLIDMNRENPRLRDVYKVNLQTGRVKMVAKNTGDIRAWFADSEFRVRGALKATGDGGLELLVRKNESTDWQKVLYWDLDNSENSYPVGFSKEGDFFYLFDSRDSVTSRLVKLNLLTLERKIILEDHEYDLYPGVVFGVDNIMKNPDSYEIQAVSVLRARSEWEILDDSIKDDFTCIQALEEGDFFLTSRSYNDEVWVVGFVKDDGPVSYYIYDRVSKNADFLFYVDPELANYRLAKMEPISFKSRDGFRIHGYITSPPGLERKNLPLVLHPHGGPWHRDVWGYDPDAQWLANRGYLCLQVNFRGSTGYGKNFVNAAIREWGGKMHDDLVDAVNWAVAQGYADPKKLAIYGGSYGGYATLVGAAFTPDLFRCAISVAGPNNLITLLKSFPSYWSTRMARWYARVGHPEKDVDFLKSRSPLFKVNQIKIPVMIVQGANDPRVTQEEVDQFVEAMRKQNLDYEYLLFPDEGHGLRKPENREKFYSAAEKFLAKHLGGRIER